MTLCYAVLYLLAGHDHLLAFSLKKTLFLNKELITYIRTFSFKHNEKYYFSKKNGVLQSFHYKLFIAFIEIKLFYHLFSPHTSLLNHNWLRDNNLHVF